MLATLTNEFAGKKLARVRLMHAGALRPQNRASQVRKLTRLSLTHLVWRQFARHATQLRLRMSQVRVLQARQVASKRTH
ncbi:hypothetical protein EB083_06095 [bacterium]|nr:hypothetical protein [bacterium]